MLVAGHVCSVVVKKSPVILEKDVCGQPSEESLYAAGSTGLIRAFYTFFDDRGVKLSEDLAFCERWRRCVGEVWANVNHLIGHIGPFNYAIRYADYLESKAKASSEGVT